MKNKPMVVEEILLTLYVKRFFVRVRRKGSLQRDLVRFF